MNSWKIVSAVFIVATVVLSGVLVGAYTGAIPLQQKGTPLQSTSLVSGFLFDGEYAPMFVGVNQNFWTDQGLSVQLIPGQGSSFGISQVAAGKVDFGLADVGSIMNAVNKGTPVQCIAAQMYSPPFGVISYKDQNIKTLKDLEGFTVISSPYDITPTVIKAVMVNNGLNGSALHVKLVTASDIVGAFLTQHDAGSIGWIDVEWVEANLVNNGQFNGSLSWLPMSNYVQNYFSNCLFTRTSLISSNPTLVREMVAGWDKAVQFSAQNPAQTAQIFVTYNPTATLSDIQEKVKLSVALWTPPSGTSFGFMPPSAVQSAFDVYKNIYSLPSTFNINSAFTNQFQPTSS